MQHAAPQKGLLWHKYGTLASLSWSYDIYQRTRRADDFITPYIINAYLVISWDVRQNKKVDGLALKATVINGKTGEMYTKWRHSTDLTRHFICTLCQYLASERRNLSGQIRDAWKTTCQVTAQPWGHFLQWNKRIKWMHYGGHQDGQFCMCDVAICYTPFDWLVESAESAMFDELSFWVSDDTAYFTKHRCIATQDGVHGWPSVFFERQNWWQRAKRRYWTKIYPDKVRGRN